MYALPLQMATQLSQAPIIGKVKEPVYSPLELELGSDEDELSSGSNVV
jgi:hypothetical protein